MRLNKSPMIIKDLKILNSNPVTMSNMHNSSLAQKTGSNLYHFLNMGYIVKQKAGVLSKHSPLPELLFLDPAEPGKLPLPALPLPFLVPLVAR